MDGLKFCFLGFDDVDVVWFEFFSFLESIFFYFYGGGYVFGLLCLYGWFIGGLVCVCGCRVLVVDYCFVFEYIYLGVFEDSVSVYC